MGRKGRGTETEIPEGSGTSWHMTVTQPMTQVTAIHRGRASIQKEL